MPLDLRTWKQSSPDEWRGRSPLAFQMHHCTILCLTNERFSARPEFSPADYTSRTAVSDASELGPVIDAVLAANPQQVETYRGGKEGVLGFLVGQVMKETQGKADAKVVNGLLREKLKQ